MVEGMACKMRVEYQVGQYLSRFNESERKAENLRRRISRFISPDRNSDRLRLLTAIFGVRQPHLAANAVEEKLRRHVPWALCGKHIASDAAEEQSLGG